MTNCTHLEERRRKDWRGCPRLLTAPTYCCMPCSLAGRGSRGRNWPRLRPLRAAEDNHQCVVKKKKNSFYRLARVKQDYETEKIP